MRNMNVDVRNKKQIPLLATPNRVAEKVSVIAKTVDE